MLTEYLVRVGGVGMKEFRPGVIHVLYCTVFTHIFSTSGGCGSLLFHLDLDPSFTICIIRIQISYTRFVLLKVKKHTGIIAFE